MAPGGGRVYAAVVAAATGSVVCKVTWESKNPTYVFPTATGQYAVVAGGATTLYSKGLDFVIKRVTGDASFLSPDRRVLARALSRNGEHEASLFDAATLEPLTV
jgi:hypothetical protein